MAFPSVQARTVWQGAASNATSHSVTMPGSISAGDLLICVFSSDGSPTCSTTSSGWIKLGQASNSTVVTGAIFWKIAEGGDSLTVTTSATEQASAITYRITGGYYVAGTSANGSSTNSNPPSQAVTDGTQDYLWIATRSGDSTVVATVAPTNYSNLTTQAAAGTGGASTNVADRTLNTGSAQDPGTFTSASEQWVSWTLCVSPIQTVVSVSPSSATIGVNAFTELTANVQRNSANVSGATVTAASSDATKATALAVTKSTELGDFDYRSSGTPETLVYTTPGGTSPLGYTIRRFTESTATNAHQGGWQTFGNVAGERFILAIEIRVVNRAGVTARIVSQTDGTVVRDAAIWVDDGQTVFGTGNTSANTATSRNLGDSWWLWTIDLTLVAAGDGDIDVVLNPETSENINISTRTGDASAYFELGYVGLYRAPVTTDSSGNATVLVRGVATGTSNVDATSLFVTSSDSAITVGATGDTYNDSLTESASASDLLTAAPTFARALTESASGSDLLATAATFGAAATESATATDALGTAGTFAGALTESAAASELLDGTRVFEAALTDAAAATDALVSELAGRTFDETLVEAAGATDSDGAFGAAPLPPIGLLLGGSGNLLAVVTLTTSGALTDAATASETLSAAGTFGRAATESASAADVLATAATRPAGFTESAAATDSAADAQTFAVAVTESAAASDQVATDGGADRDLIESASATDALTTVGTFGRAITESATASDAHTVARTTAGALTEAAAATDALVTAATYTAALTESAGATETLVPSGAGGEAFAEAASAADLFAVTIVAAVTMTESAAASDATQAGSEYTRAMTEAAAATDAVARQYQAAVAFVEAVTAADPLVVAQLMAQAWIESAAADDGYEAADGSVIEASVRSQWWRVRGVDRVHEVQGGRRTRRTGSNRKVDVTQ